MQESITKNVEPYVKSLEDELDWKLLEQLHGAVSQISGFCFEIKKFCVTTTFFVLTLLVKFTSNNLDQSLFITAIIIPLCFWFLDSVGYYYQVKLRGTMQNIREKIQTRGSGNIVSHTGEKIIADERVDLPRYKLVFNSFANHSMWLYAIMILLNIFAWYLFTCGEIA
jgi:hypothetical protein